jgi:hypothetical protein
MPVLTKTLTAADLKRLNRHRFDREYSKWVEWQWQDDWYVENTHERFKEKYQPKGIEVEELHYCISYSQGDYGSFDGRVFLAEWMEAVQVCRDGPTYAERYPALYIACSEDGSYMRIYGADDRRGWRVDFQEGWKGVGPCGIFANMPDEDWEDLVREQASEADLETELLNYCRAIGQEIYDDLRDAYEDATSEEAFIESCEANDVTFEIETEDDEDEIPA